MKHYLLLLLTKVLQVLMTLVDSHALVHFFLVRLSTRQLPELEMRIDHSQISEEDVRAARY